MSQQTFSFDEPERLRYSQQAAAILARLQQGPASNSELIQIAQRFGARLHELRKCGHTIEIIEKDHATGHRMYQLRTK